MADRPEEVVYRTPMSSEGISNEQLTVMLRRIADLLRGQNAGQYRIRAYERAAESVETLDRAVADLYAQGGRQRLLGIVGIGESLADVIGEYLETGRSATLESLEKQVS